MPGGRPRKPVEEHLRDGTRPHGGSRKSRPALVGGREAPERPPGLDRDASAVWDLVVADLMEGNVLDRADWSAVEAFATYVSLARQARRDRKREGRYIEGQKGSTVIAPWVKLELEAWGKATQLGDGLGLSPRGRAALGLRTKGAGRRHAQDSEGRGVPPRARGLGVVQGGRA